MSARPNILFVMSDDHAQWAVGTYGNDELNTPTIDYISDSGVQMNNAFCPTPVCSPARASLFTGLLPSQHGIHDHIAAEYDDKGWLVDTITIPELLSDAGYVTGISGKWHCGQPQQAEKFDHSFGVRDQNGYKSWYKSSTGDRMVTDDALEFLRSNREDPFFLFVGYTSTHSPWKGNPDRLVERHRNSPFDDIPNDTMYALGKMEKSAKIYSDPKFESQEARSQYYGSVEGIDEQFGRLIDELVVQQIFEDTLIVYTSDHGLHQGTYGLWGKGNATRPPNMLDESIRVPLLLSGHRKVQAQQPRKEFVDHCDVFQTLLDFASVPIPEPNQYPGSTFLPMIIDASGDPNWKKIQICEYGNVRMARSETHKLIRRYPSGPNILFDLEMSEREIINVLDQPNNEQVVADLDTAIEDLFDEYGIEQNSGLQTEQIPPHNPLEVWRELSNDVE